MMFADIDSVSIATWTVGIATVLTMVILAALGAYLGSIRTVNRIEVSVAQLYGKLQKEMMIELSQMRADIATIAATAKSLHSWVEAIGNGETPHIAKIQQELVQHEHTLENHSTRIVNIERKQDRCPTCRGTRDEP